MRYMEVGESGRASDIYGPRMIWDPKFKALDDFLEPLLEPLRFFGLSDVSEELLDDSLSGCAAGPAPNAMLGG